MSVQPCHAPRCDAPAAAPDAIELVVEASPRSLGDFEVRRMLPAPERPRVGPFVFFDHMGPARFDAGRGIDVRPHPHIGLATVTYLFDGVILHRDSLGSVQPITPGAVNWMTAGRGIVHSERTPDELRTAGSTLHGLQIWLALPRDAEETEPSFVHHPAEALPRRSLPGVELTIVLGEAWGRRSPVATFSETLYVAGELEPGAGLELPADSRERALYVAAGALALDGAALRTGAMAVLRRDAALRIEAREPTLVALFGGAPLDGERHLWWNFVSSSKERIERAKADWKAGRFPAVPGDDEFIPLPERAP